MCSAGFTSAWEERPVTPWLRVLPAPVSWIRMRAKAAMCLLLLHWLYTELGVFRAVTETGLKFCFVFAPEHSPLCGGLLGKANIAD